MCETLTCTVRLAIMFQPITAAIFMYALGLGTGVVLAVRRLRPSRSGA